MVWALGEFVSFVFLLSFVFTLWCGADSCVALLLLASGEDSEGRAPNVMIMKALVVFK